MDLEIPENQAVGDRYRAIRHARVSTPIFETTAPCDPRLTFSMLACLVVDASFAEFAKAGNRSNSPSQFSREGSPSVRRRQLRDHSLGPMRTSVRRRQMRVNERGDRIHQRCSRPSMSSKH
jgi:hypothetical protein